MWYLGSTPIVARNYGLVLTSFFFTTIAATAVSLRVYTRALVVRKFGTDDYLIVFAMLGSIAFFTAAMYQIRFGLGDAVRLDQLIDFLKALYATVLSYTTTQLLLKFSLLFQYRRIFQTSQARKLFAVLLTILTGYALFAEGSSLITCWPVAKYWDDTIAGGCIDRSILHYVLAGINIAIDITLLMIPIVYLRNLQVTHRAKLVLIGCFACGGVACVIAIIRLQSLYVNNSAPIDQQPLKGVDIAIWSHLELNIAITCASVPALKPIFVKIIPKLSSYHGSSRSHAYIKTRDETKSGSRQLRSTTRHATADIEHSDERDVGIKVDHCIEMKTIYIEDDSSQKNLVTGSWATGSYAAEAKAERPPR